MPNLIVASTSTVHGETYLSYLKEPLEQFFKDVKTITFIPFARPGGITHDAYTQFASTFFKKLDKEVLGLHTFKDPVKAIKESEAIFTGGGNTFVLVNSLYKFKCMAPLRETLLKGIPYLGSSAGSNICGISMQTTNDMPIVYPPSFKTLGVVPFNINPHYLDPDPNSKHMGETREQRIKEFHAHNNLPVVGLREGSWLEVNNTNIMLKGPHSAAIFTKNNNRVERDSSFDFRTLA